MWRWQPPSCRRRDRRSQSAFTLLELLIVIALVAFFSAIALPSLQRIRQQAARANVKRDPEVDRGFTAVEATFAALRPATIAFTPRQQMQWKRPGRVSAIVAASMDAAQLTSELQQRLGTDAGVAALNIRIAPQMELRLTGDAFHIEPITPERQPVGPTGAVEWSWSVTPLKGGTQTLYLSVNAVMSVRGQQASSSVRVLEQPIDVQITTIESVQAFVADNWQFIVGTLAVPAFAWAWKRRHP